MTRRVLHLTASYPPATGGVARYAHALASQQPGASVLTVGAIGRTTRRIQDGVRVVRVARQGVVHSEPTGLVALGFGPRLLRMASKSDLLHIHLPFPLVLPFAPLIRRKTPIVITFHNEIQGTLGIPAAVRVVHDLLLRRLLQQASRIIVTTQSYAAASPSLADLMGKVRIVPYGLESGYFARADSAAGVRREDNLLLYVGGLRYYKGLDVLLRSMVELPAARLWIVGDGPEGEKLRRMATDLGLDSRISWLGHVEDEELPGLYRRVSALVLPSTGLSESFGIVQLEAHANETPVVSSDLPGVREVNPDGVTGLLAEPGDVQSLAVALRRILADKELRERLGRQAHERVHEQFTARQMLEGVARVYDEV